jgi:hypothetical protein
MNQDKKAVDTKVEELLDKYPGLTPAGARAMLAEPLKGKVKKAAQSLQRITKETAKDA